MKIDSENATINLKFEIKSNNVWVGIKNEKLILPEEYYIHLKQFMNQSEKFEDLNTIKKVSKSNK